MSITVNIYYSGKNGSAFEFVQEMIKSGTVEAIRKFNRDTVLRDEYNILGRDKYIRFYTAEVFKVIERD